MDRHVYKYLSLESFDLVFGDVDPGFHLANQTLIRRHVMHHERTVFTRKQSSFYFILTSSTTSFGITSKLKRTNHSYFN